ncbi:hypothetical protein EVAR_72892_1 [Eumeta japonica]|uniref:Uncharacterized protein n=1 Tax=Eumeta variegata TaxID=151549 RepID=A0A4C1T460_EUMVA|nr:hypothetical protein EVAR_72892_1 [Eumeta japonica]
MTVRPPIATSEGADSGTRYGTARNRCRKLASCPDGTASDQGQILKSGPLPLDSRQISARLRSSASSAPHDRRTQSGAPQRWNLSRYREGVRPSVTRRIVAQASKHPDSACACADNSVVLGGPQLLRNSRGHDLGSAIHPRRGTTRLTGRMACRCECDEDRRLIDRSAAYHATEGEAPRTGSGMAAQGEISRCADRSPHAHGCSGGACYPPEQSCAVYATSNSHLPLRIKVALYKGCIRSRITYAVPAWYALCSTSQRKRIQSQQNIALQMIVGSGWYILNDVVARDLCLCDYKIVK